MIPCVWLAAKCVHPDDDTERVRCCPMEVFLLLSCSGNPPADCPKWSNDYLWTRNGQLASGRSVVGTGNFQHPWD